MTKTLILMRHGEANNPPAHGSDYERTLTPNGEAGVRAQGKLIAEKKLCPELILCSSATRTRQTCDLLRMGWEMGCEPVVEYRTDIYQASPSDIMKLIRGQDATTASLLVVGHNPTIHQIAMLLSAAPADVTSPRIGGNYPPGSFAAFEFDLQSWAALSEGGGRLIAFSMPR